MKSIFLAGASAGTILLTGCGSEWLMTEQKFFKYKNRDVRIAAKVMLTEKKSKLNAARADGVDFELRIYSGGYATILKETTAKAGGKLEETGTTNVAMIFTHAISEPRLGGTPSNSYPDLCAEIKLEKSNLREWTRVGCVNQNDTPSESPTGGLGLDP